MASGYTKDCQDALAYHQRSKVSGKVRRHCWAQLRHTDREAQGMRFGDRPQTSSRRQNWEWLRWNARGCIRALGKPLRKIFNKYDICRRDKPEQHTGKRSNSAEKPPTHKRRARWKGVGGRAPHT
jgi:hypothetical protein